MTPAFVASFWYVGCVLVPKHHFARGFFVSQVFVRSALLIVGALAGSAALAQNRPGPAAGSVIRQAPVVRPSYRTAPSAPTRSEPVANEEQERGQALPPTVAEQRPAVPAERPAQPSFERERQERPTQPSFERGAQSPRDFNRGENFGQRTPVRQPSPAPLPVNYGRVGRNDGRDRGGYGRPYPPRGYPQPPIYNQPPYGQPPYGQPPIGQPPYGQPPYGQPPYDDDDGYPDVGQATVPGLNNVYRFFNGAEHFLTLNFQEGLRAGYQSEGLAFRTFADAAGGVRLPLFRCLVYGAGHFATNDPACEGQQQEGLYGFVNRAPSPGAGREVVRCLGGVDHLITLDRNECIRAGYRIEAILGYVP